MELYTDVTNCTYLVDALVIDCVEAAFRILKDHTNFQNIFQISHTRREKIDILCGYQLRRGPHSVNLIELFPTHCFTCHAIAMPAKCSDASEASNESPCMYVVRISSSVIFINQYYAPMAFNKVN